MPLSDFARSVVQPLGVNEAVRFVANTASHSQGEIAMVRLAASVAAVVALAVLASPAEAGKFNKVLSIGDAAPAWTNLEGTDGKKHSLAGLKDKDVVVFVVTCNHCPVAVAYEKRIIDFTRKYAGKKVAVVAYCCNNGAADKLPAMKARAKGKNFNFTYVHDASQKIGRAYGATVTPEFFVLGKDRKIVYMGAMDDSQNIKNVRVNYLEAAVDAALRGETPATTETRARGCSVKYE
jgi:peroxiredoxin